MDTNNFIKVECIQDEELNDQIMNNEATESLAEVLDSPYTISNIDPIGPLGAIPQSDENLQKILPLKICRVKKKLATKSSSLKEKKSKSIKKNIVPCSNCSQEFLSMKEFKNHFSDNHISETISFKCPLCSKTFNLQRLFQSHKRSDCSKDSFQKKSMDLNNFIKVELVEDDHEPMEQDNINVELIPLDGVTSQNHCEDALDGLTGPIESHTQPKYICDTVENDTSTSSIITTNTTSRKKETRKIPPLKICRTKKNSKKLITKISTSNEKKSNTSKVKRSIVSCGCCNEEFVAVKGFKNHFSVNHSSEILSFKCPLCSKIFQVQKLLQNHRRSCLTKGAFEKCATCEKVFASKNLLKKHIVIHSDEKPHQCADCLKTFRTKSDLRTHTSVHIPLEMRKTHICDECGQSFTLRRNFLTHLKMHKDPEIFICELCGHTFKTKGNLKSHQVHHTGEKKHECPLCQKCFASKAYLKIHILLHSNIKLHKCEICGKDFARKSILTKHLYVHNGIRPYPCKFCNKAFRAKDKLVVHERIHTGEKPYKCEYCPVAFCESGNLQKHKRNVHKDVMQNEAAAAGYSDSRPYPNKVCDRETINTENSAQFAANSIDMFQSLVKINENFTKNSLNHSNEITNTGSNSEINQYNSEMHINNSENCASKLFMALQ